MLRLSEAIDRSFGLFESSCIHAKVNITSAVRSSVHLVSHKPLPIYVGRVGRVAQAVFKCICYYSPRLKKIRPRIWNKCLDYPDSNVTKKNSFQIHSILIGDKKLSCFEALILIIPEKNHQLCSRIVDVPYQSDQF